MLAGMLPGRLYWTAKVHCIASLTSPHDSAARLQATLGATVEGAVVRGYQWSLLLALVAYPAHVLLLYAASSKTSAGGERVNILLSLEIQQ